MADNIIKQIDVGGTTYDIVGSNSSIDLETNTLKTNSISSYPMSEGDSHEAKITLTTDNRKAELTLEASGEDATANVKLKGSTTGNATMTLTNTDLVMGNGTQIKGNLKLGASLDVNDFSMTNVYSIEGVEHDVSTQTNYDCIEFNSNLYSDCYSVTAEHFYRYIDADTTPVEVAYKDTILVGASASSAGVAGLVPAPAAGNNNKFLRGDGTWQNPTSGAQYAYDSANSTLIITI